MIPPEAGAEQGARTTSPNGQAQTDPPGEVEYNPLKLDKLRSKSNVLKGVWTDPSRIPVLTRPEANTWFRVRPGEDYTDIIDLVVATNASGSSDRNPVYVATENVLPELERWIKPHRVVVGITRHDRVQFLWVRALGTGDNSWTSSVWIAMDAARTNWIALESVQSLGEYKRHRAPRSKEWGEPEWPDQTLEEIVGLALRDRIIDSLEHPVAQRLIGLD